MSRRFINQLKENEAINEIYQLSELILRPNKNGNLYLQFAISDRTGTLGGRFWNVSEEQFQSLRVNDYICCEGTVQRFLGNLQFIAKKLSKVDSASISSEDFSRGNTIDTQILLKRLKEITKTLKSTDLRNLIDCFLSDDDFLAKFCAVPAGIKLHHAYPGGLLEHTLYMMEMVIKIAPLYGNRLNSDILLVGAFLHDIGKIEELSSENGLIYTDAGQLLGHPFLGVQILLKKIAETEKLTGESFNAEMAMILQHLIISHHGELENGSSKVPMTLEALALFYIDSLDAKLCEFEKHIIEDPSAGSAWTNYIPQIERKLYKNHAE
ncbi:MAG: HD domain-containing protein [Planctomycetia bacterium]|nr:HD domain-containing protein [Planctomycetia bacterium]